jgi:3-oxoadipate enol-lactonase
MSFASVNGQKIYFEDTGGDAPPVIFSHGFLMDHSMFDPQVEALSSEFRCITWDERGHGETPVDAPFTYWDSAQDAFALLDHLGIDRAVFAGMSQGGFITMRAALLAPERVRAMVLIDTQAGAEPAEMAPLFEAMHDEWKANGPDAVQETIATMILGSGYDATDWYKKWAAIPRESFSFPFRTLMDRDVLFDRLSEITAPTIIFHGDLDTAIPMADADYLQEHLSGAGPVVVVKGAGHAANLTHADQVNGPLREFLSHLA